MTKKLKIAGIIAIVVGLLLVILGIGSSINLGTLVAGVGIFVYVYALFYKPKDREP